MSIVTFLLENKLTALKLFFVTAVSTGTVATVVMKQHSPPKQEILGNESMQAVSTALPTATPTPEDIIQIARRRIQTVVEDTVDTVNDILGESTAVVKNTASQSADKVKDSIVQSTVGTIVDQIEKLPVDDQNRIKDVVCK
jgi:hypothetical protein